MEASENEYKAFIGKKADYYIEKWTEIEKRHTKTSWNWGAFLFGLLWMLYRKMYFYTLIAVSILCGIGIIESFLGIGDVFDVILSFIFCLLFGIFGNYLYHRYTENKILRIKRECKEDSSLIAELARRGGTTWVAPTLLVLLILWATLSV